MNRYLKIISIVCFVFATFNLAEAQFNIKVGYSIAYTEGKGINAIIDRYNDENPWLEQKFKNYHYLNGLEIGVRYKWHNLGIDLSLNTLSKKSEGLGTNQNTGVFFSDEWNLSLSEYSIGLENYIGGIGIGAALGSRNCKISTNIASSGRDKNVYIDSEYSTKFYLVLSLPSNSTAVAVKPYIQFPIKKFNVASMENEIFKDNPRDSSLFDEDFVFYGISLLLYNGPQ